MKGSKTVSRFRAFIGVDQTGAALSSGRRAKRLPAAVVFRTGDDWKMSVGRLASLDQPSLSDFLERDTGDGSLAGVALVVDCVFGLSESVWRPRKDLGEEIWRLVSRTRREVHYGRTPAARFFGRLRSAGPRSKGKVPASELPRRECELLCGANSVFQIHPFQKNIQTGTFRIWRDLAQAEKKWLNFWPFETLSSADPELPWIFEGYPTLFWRELFGSRVRDPARLQEIFRARHLEHSRALGFRRWKELSRDADLSDAAVLAVGAWVLQSRGALMKDWPRFRAGEGWILGLNRPR